MKEELITEKKGLKEFEKKQLDWWCNYYRLSLRTLTIRTRQYIDGELPKGILLALLETLESDLEGRKELV
jgi:hypothetical protein